MKLSTRALNFFAASLLASAAGPTFVASQDGITVYDSVNSITWQADSNLAETNRFGLPVCDASDTQPCINSSGSMNYASAVAWVSAMNAARYLGRTDWQLPTTPMVDKTCGKTGPGGAGNFGFGCTAGALDSLYNALGFKAPNTAVQNPNSTTAPFINIQPYLYWTQTAAGPNQGNATFSFATGWTGANTLPTFLYLFPMIAGRLPGAAASSGNGLLLSADKQTVYDPVTNITWVANGNLAASNTFGLPRCTDPTTPALCVALDGAMTWASAMQFISNMNSSAYLGQTNWQAPAIDGNCANYGCGGTKNPMGNLFYRQLGIVQGNPVIPTFRSSVGPFKNLQPYLYWTCGGDTIQSACQDAGPVNNQEWSYSFGSGFQGTDVLANDLYVTAYFLGQATPPPVPSISKVANAEGESPIIAPNAWVEIKGSNLAPAGDIRIWGTADFVNTAMPTKLDGVSVTVNGRPAFVYYISPTQINILTPPDSMNGSVQVVVTNNGLSASASAQAAPLSPSFFVFNDGQHVAAVHSDGSLLGPPSLSAPGYPFTPAVPGETVLIFANGFGSTSTPVVSGSSTQSGELAPTPVVTIGGVRANVAFAGLISPGLFQFNVVIPQNTPGGDELITATYSSVTTQAGALFTLAGATPPTSVTYYVAPNGKDSWSGTLAAANPQGTDGPFATFDRARSAVQSVSKFGLKQITVQFRGGTYTLSAPVMFTSADSGSASLSVSYKNYPGETPVFSGGTRVTGWINTGGNTWQATLPSSTQYFENLYYNGARRLRPRLGSGGANGVLGPYLRVAGTVYLTAPGPPAKSPDINNCPAYVAGNGWECFDRFQYGTADPISGAWKNLAPAMGNPCGQPAGNAALQGDIEVLDWEQFSTPKLRVSCIDTKNSIVYMTAPTPINMSKPTQSGFIAGNRYIVENVQDALTTPGQWFLNRAATPWTLTYLTNTGENPNVDTVIVPQAPQVFVATGLQYVTFQGLTFEHDNFVVPAAGHRSVELEPDIPAAVSFQNSQHITFDSNVTTQIGGTGLEFISCIDASSPDYCVANDSNALTANDKVQNSAFYDLGVLGVRIGDPYQPSDSDANMPQFMVVQNNVVEGYGRTIPASFGIGQGIGHDNLYTHNEVYDGYHCGISISEQAGDLNKPNASAFNNTISFNHVWNLLQGIMNDGGSIRIQSGNNAYTAPGNKILNNKIHDVTDASATDGNGYGGDGIYLDNQSGLIDVENNLVYRVSGTAIEAPQGPSQPNEANTIRNNILAFARLAMVNLNNPYPYGVPAAIPEVYSVTDNIFLFDRDNTLSPKFFVQGGCLYPGGAPYTQFQFFNSNLYWRTDGAFASENKAFAVQPNASPTSSNAPCSGNANDWNFYTFAQWQLKVGEDVQSVVANPGFANPTYPADDFSLPKGSPGPGFVVFDLNQPGRTSRVLMPPAVPPTFPTKLFNPASDY